MSPQIKEYGKTNLFGPFDTFCASRCSIRFILPCLRDLAHNVYIRSRCAFGVSEVELACSHCQVFPFLTVRFEVGDLVISIVSGEAFRGGVAGTVTSGERGRRCPRSR
jgi:hypothetical protein